VRQRVFVETVGHVLGGGQCVSGGNEFTAFNPGRPGLDAHPTDTDALTDGIEHLEQQARPVLDRAAVGVCARIGARVEELADQIVESRLKLLAVPENDPQHLMLSSSYFGGWCGSVLSGVGFML
jgi:hypothetical protein